MDDQLKQRLIGATIIVVLVVAFVPLLFDESPAPVSTSTESISSEEPSPAPGRVVEAPAEPLAEGEDYRIIPLTDTAGADAAATVPKQDEPPPAAPGTPAEFLGDEGAEAVEVPTPDSPLGQGTRGVAPVVAVPEKSRPKKAADVSPAHGESAPTPGSRSPLSAGSPKPPNVSGKAPASRAKAPPAAPSVATKLVPDKSGAVPAAAATAPSTITAKPAVAAARKEDKKTSPKVTESQKPSVAAKPLTALPSPKKKPEASIKPAVAEAGQDNADGASAGASPAAPAKPPIHTKSMVARKPKADEGPTRWVVQTYSFTNEANAKSLVEKLRKNKFDAFIETVPGAGGVNYRVSVGPEADKARAEQARKRLESSVGMSGTVTGRK